MDSGVEGKVHTYKILQCMPACAAGGRKLGRPRRIVVHAWTELDLAELTILRRLNDSKLRPNQLAEVDGDIVARGSGVLAGEDETAEVVAWDEGQNAANFAQTLVWDGYLRSVGAADELANQLKRAHDQILELSRQLSAETIAGQKRLNDLTAEHRTQMSNRASEHRSQVTAMTLDPRIEDVLRRSLRDIAQGVAAPLDPQLLHGLAASAEGALGRFVALGATPVVLTTPDLRRYVRAIFERKLPQVSVVSFREIDPLVPLRVAETLKTPQLS